MREKSDKGEVIKVESKLLKKYGVCVGVVAGLAMHRAAAVMGPFELSAGDVVRFAGISRRTAQGALADLQADGFLVPVGGGQGARLRFTLGGETGANIAPVLGALLRRVFKGGANFAPVLDAAAIRLGLAQWDIEGAGAEAVLAGYPAWWVAAKLRSCAGKTVAAERRHAYFHAALNSCTQAGEVARVAAGLEAEAARARRAANQAQARRVAERAQELAARFATALESLALGWWGELGTGQRDTLAAEYLAGVPADLREMGLWQSYDPESCAASRAHLVGEWYGAVADRLMAEAEVSIGVDVQRDGRLIYVALAWLPASPAPLPSRWVIGWGEAGRPAEVPASMAGAGLIDEGDGVSTRLAQELAALWGGSAADGGATAGPCGAWRTWKGGAEPRAASGYELRPVDGDPRRCWGNERAWAGLVLGWLADPAALGVAPHLLGEEGLWSQLAGRLSVAEGTGEDHAFDALKMAAAAGGAAGTALTGLTVLTAGQEGAK